MATAVKSERHDDAEINEMARRILEQNRQKQMQQPGVSTKIQSNDFPMFVHQCQCHFLFQVVHPGGYNQVGGPMQMGRPGQPMISNYFQSNSRQNQLQAAPNADQNGLKKVDKLIDEDSRKGRFGWGEFEKNLIPYIFRSNSTSGGNEKYTSVRMVERKLLNKFLSVLPTEVNSCHCIRSYYITDAEAKLLNEVNIKHADLLFGKEAFTTKDLVVRMSDAKEFYRFLDLCYKKLVLKKSNASDRCGFFR